MKRKRNIKKIIIAFIIIVTSFFIICLIIKGEDSDNWKNMSFYEETKEQTLEYKLYEFGSSDCNICYQMREIVDLVIEEKNDVIDYEFIDVIIKPNFTNKYNVNVLPTYIIVDKNGNVKKRLSGGTTREEFLKFVNEVIGE